MYTTLIRYIEGDATTEERRKTILWLNEDAAHIDEYMSLRKLYNLSVWNTQQTTNTGESFQNKKSTFLSGTAGRLLKIASVFLVGVLSAYFFFLKDEEPSRTQTIHVPSGQRAEVLLSDGTKVWLNSGTTFSFPDRFTAQNRNVHLEGEGYFQVASQKGQLFVVNTDKYGVKVLGTEFNVKSYNKRDVFETSLLDGSVEIFSHDSKETLRLSPSEVACETAAGLVKTPIDDYDHFKWREGLLCFENEDVASLFSKLELYYDIRIEVRKELLLKHAYTGKFRIRDGIEHVLRVLQVKHQFTYTKNEENNVIVIE